jgi:hypothetical protein
MTIKTEATMKAEKYLPQADKIKYLLNGETRYYTMEELREYYKNLLKNNDTYYPDYFEREMELLLQTLEKYDGDPYGNESEKNKEYYHFLESRGFLEIIP